MKQDAYRAWLHGDNQKYKPGKPKQKRAPRKEQYVPKVHLDDNGKPVCGRRGFYTLMDKDKSKTDCTTCRRIFERWDGA